PLRDVNHDLIAAGHPPLRFEFGTYLAHLPKHWQEWSASPDADARNWAVGQAVVAEMALELLADRACQAARPRPEFADYACFSCHRDLPVGTLSVNRTPPGRLRFGTWHLALTPRLEPLLGLPGTDLAEVFHKLTADMEA